MTTRALRFCLLALSLTLTCLVSDSKSAADQYPASYDQSHTFHPFNEALKALKLHRFDIHPKKPFAKEGYALNNNIVPDHQVGYGDGLLAETTTTPKSPIPKHKKVFTKKERKKREANERKPRSYFSYTIGTPASISYSVWKPQLYKLERPYITPVLVSQGRLSIHFSAHPVYLNQGSFLDNPSKPSPSMEPPPSTTTQRTSTTSVIELSNRFGEPEPVWDSYRVPATTTTTVKPTRRPSKPSTSTFPPLFHNIEPDTPTMQRPSSEIHPPAAVVLPTRQALESRPPVSQCILAIINCCSANSRDVSSACFEKSGCPGPFGDKTPCESDVARAAIDSALT